VNDEAARLEELRSLEILDTPPEAAFDRLVELAARLLDVPIALVTLVDEHRQWFKARVGLDVDKTPRTDAFCAHAIEDAGTFVVGDARQDPRFEDNPLVVGDPHIRFYAGHPLRGPDGNRLGTICVIDQTPRELTAVQRELLEFLAGQAEVELELRRAGLEQREARRRLSETEQRLRSAEGALRASEERYRSLVENASMALVVHVDGAIRFANRAAAEVHGYATPEELIGRSILDTVPPDRRADVRAIIDRVRRGERVRDLRRTLLRPDGTHITVAVHVTLVTWEGQPAHQVEIRDVSERAAADELLRQAEERFRLVHQFAGVGMAVTELDRTFSRVNGALCEILDRSEDELLGTSFETITHPDDVGRDTASFEALRAGETDVYETEKRYLRPDGSSVPVLLRVSAVRSSSGALQFLVACMLDLTRQREAEEARRQHLSELQAVNDELAQAVAIKDHVLATASHDMRTPITAITGLADVLLRHGVAPDASLPVEERREALEAILRQSRRLDRLVGDVLSLSVMEGQVDLRHQPVLLEALVTELLDDLGLDVAVATDIDPELVAEVDPDRVAQILGNLLTNAQKYGGDKVTVSAQVHGEWVDVRVHDDGPGVPASFVPHLFDKFSRASRTSTSRRSRGTGLGLAIVRAVAQAHGGDAWYEDTRPGACFVVRLPVAAASSRSLPAVPSLEQVPADRMALVVGDAPDVLDALRQALDEVGCRVVTVEDPARALTIARTQRPDLVIADADLSGIGGFELTSRLKADTATFGIPVLVLTHDQPGEEAARALALGADDVAHKPVDRAELQARVLALLQTAARTAALQERNESLDRASKTDALTGLVNRRGLDQHAQRVASFARRHGEPVSVLLIDLDHFKQVNDGHGHLAGDHALQVVARSIATQLRAEDITGRWGGEEFVVLSPGTDLAGACAAAERIRVAVAGTAIEPPVGGTVRCTVSIGVAEAVDGDLERALAQADQALYAAKAAGRDTVRSAPPAVDEVDAASTAAD
jgi:diguanylate cyclase (GGDEF)-like protein/PAS domain S-box-containing protein